MSKTILVVDDEKDIADLLRFNLENEGYQVETAENGIDAVQRALKILPELIILDIMLPGQDGLEVMRQLRNTLQTRHIPIILLTAKSSEFDEVLGLELGADDYITKPVSLRKLFARVKTALRKSAPPVQKVLNDEIIKFGDIEINAAGYTLKIQKQEIRMPKKEFEILLFLAKRPGRVVTREILLNHIWADNVVVVDRTIDVHIRKIREKLGKENANLISTIKGVGYRLVFEP